MSVGDFKVIGINDEGTQVKHGGNDLDKIARILNGEELSVTINIDNEWSFNDSKLVLKDTSGNNKITISTSEESADWFINIPVLGGNRTPVFTDLSQELTNKDIDGSENTLTNISDSSLLQITDKAKLPDETPFLDEANVFTQKQTIQLDGDILCDLYRPNSEMGDKISINFDGDNTTERTTYGQMYVSITDETEDSEDSNFGILLYSAGVLKNRLFISSNGNLFVGDSQRLVFSDAGQTSAHVMTFPDNDTLVVGDTDSRLSDSRDPNTHASSHGDGQSDEISISWNQITSDVPGSFTPSSHASSHLDNGSDSIPVATTSRTGLLPVLSNNANEFLNGQGSWAVPSLGSVSIDVLNDVDTSTVAPSNNDVLTWNSTDAEWVPAAPPGAAGGEANDGANVGTGEGEIYKNKVSTTINLRTLKEGSNVTISTGTDEVTISSTDTIVDALSDLSTDVNITTPQDGQILEYYNASSKWINVTHSFADIGDIPTTIAELTDDMNINSPTNLQVLAYNTSSSKWENNTFNAETTGKALASGNSSSTQFVIAHGLGSTPSYVFVDCSSHAIARTFDVDGTNITVDFVSAPGSGTDNVIIYWKVIA